MEHVCSALVYLTYKHAGRTLALAQERTIKIAVLLSFCGVAHNPSHMIVDRSSLTSCTNDSLRTCLDDWGNRWQIFSRLPALTANLAAVLFLCTGSVVITTIHGAVGQSVSPG